MVKNEDRLCTYGVLCNVFFWLTDVLGIYPNLIIDFFLHGKGKLISNEFDLVCVGCVLTNN